MTRADLGPVPPVRGHGWKFNFIGGQKASSSTISRKGESPDYYNYLSANSTANNASGVHSYEEITYQNVYPGINVRYYTAPAQGLENDIIVKPGSDASAIKLQVDGIDELKLDENGALILPTSVGDVTISSPVSYLLGADGKRTKVDVKYQVTGKNTLGFIIPAYDKSQTLVIDPIVMRWATWISGTSTASGSHGHGIDLDAEGAIYVTGKYTSGLLVTVGAFQTTNFRRHL